MEHCDRHGGDHIFYEYHRIRQTDCPLCVALERISTLEQELNDLGETIMTLEDKIDSLRESVSDG